MEYWNGLVAQLVLGQQEELKAVMLEMIGDYGAREVKFEDLTIAEIIGWLIDNQVEINYAGLIK